MKIDTTTSSQIPTLENRLKAMNATGLERFTSTSSARDAQADSIRKTGAELTSTVTSGMANFSKELAYNANLPERPLAAVSLSTDAPGDTTASDAKPSAPSSTPAASSPTSTPAGTTQTDEYEYNGLYLLYSDSTGKIRQTHLTDYTDEIEGTEEVVPLDVHRDGDEDVLFRI